MYRIHAHNDPSAEASEAEEKEERKGEESKPGEIWGYMLRYGSYGELQARVFEVIHVKIRQVMFLLLDDDHTVTCQVQTHKA